MGCKLPSSSAICPTEIIDGELRIWIGSHYVYYYNKAFKYNFKLDDIAFTYSPIYVYLSNDTHKMVIRKDGTYSIYTADNILLAYGTCNISEAFSKLHIVQGGALSYSNNGFRDFAGQIEKPITLIQIDDIEDEMLLSIRGDYNRYMINPLECKEYLQDVASNNYPFPEITIYDNGVFQEFHERYFIHSEVFKSGEEVIV